MKNISFEDQSILFADGFEEAFIGIGTQFNKNLSVYDKQKCINILMERDGLTEAEANEAFDYNVIGSYVGPNTPVFIQL